MDWRRLVYAILRGVLRFVAQEYYPAGSYGRRGGKPRTDRSREKEAPPPPRAEEPTYTTGWGPPKEASLVNLITVETDAGSMVAAASFIGEECFGVTRVQRERQPGESRRTRRKTQPAAASSGVDEVPAAEAAPNVPSLRDPQHAERLERMRQWGLAEHARQQAEFQRQAEATMAQRQVAEPSPTKTQRVPRSRSVGEPLSISWLAPETLLLLELGEPLTYVHAAA